jgi:hypothetical protein
MSFVAGRISRNVHSELLTEAVKAGFYETVHGKFPKLQILTIAELFDGKLPKVPWSDPDTFKKAAKEAEGGTQDVLF